jgi:fructoselysine-6-P-deglycase FrlB-like protein
MEGNYHFTWKAVAATGKIEGLYEQTIYGKTFAAASAQFESFHGPLSPDENGVCIVITSIAWQP